MTFGIGKGGCLLHSNSTLSKGRPYPSDIELIRRVHFSPLFRLERNKRQTSPKDSPGVFGWIVIKECLLEGDYDE